MPRKTLFFVFIVGGVLAIAGATGTIDTLIGSLLNRFGHKSQLLIFMVVFTFALASGVIGTAGEYITFVLILVGLCKAMKLDAMTAVGMTVTGYGIGCGVSAFNPFTVMAYFHPIRSLNNPIDIMLIRNTYAVAGD